jgi:hypothetical protein
MSDEHGEGSSIAGAKRPRGEESLLPEDYVSPRRRLWPWRAPAVDAHTVGVQCSRLRGPAPSLQCCRCEE